MRAIDHEVDPDQQHADPPESEMPLGWLLLAARGELTDEQAEAVDGWQRSRAGRRFSERMRASAGRAYDGLAVRCQTPAGAARTVDVGDDPQMLSRIVAMARQRVARRGLRRSGPVAPIVAPARRSARCRSSHRQRALARSSSRAGDSGDGDSGPGDPPPPSAPGRAHHPSVDRHPVAPSQQHRRASSTERGQS